MNPICLNLPESPIGQLPYLELDDLKLPQSLSIARYLAREHNLVGKSNLEAAKADAIVDTCVDLMTQFYYKVFLVTDLQTKDSALQRFLNEDAENGLDKVEKLVKSYGSNGYSVGDGLTWADLFIHEITFSLLNYQKSILEKFPLLRAVRESVEKNERVANYLKSRPETPF